MENACLLVLGGDLCMGICIGLNSAQLMLFSSLFESCSLGRWFAFLKDFHGSKACMRTACFMVGDGFKH